MNLSLEKLNFTLSKEKIVLSNSVKYLGIYLHEHLKWDQHLNHVIKQLTRAIGMLSKVRHYVPIWLMRTIYFSLFNSHLIYCCEIWGQKRTILFQKIERLQNKALRIINFKDNNENVFLLYSKNKILRIHDFITLKNILLVKDSLEKNNPQIFHNYFKKSSDIHNHQTRAALNDLIDIPQVKTDHYGHFSVKSRSSSDWNSMQRKVDIDFSSSTRQEIIKAVKAHFYQSYINN